MAVPPVALGAPWVSTVTLSWYSVLKMAVSVEAVETVGARMYAAVGVPSLHWEKTYSTPGLERSVCGVGTDTG